MSVEPRIVYLADRLAGLSDEAFAERWAAHGRLAMSLPIWRNMVRYAQCDPLDMAGFPRPCDAIGLVWYRSPEAMDAIAREPALRQPLLDDELRTFACHVREVAMLTEERVLRDGRCGGWKLFVFDVSERPAAETFDAAGAGRITVSSRIGNGYTGSSRLPYQSIMEVWFDERRDLETALDRHRDRLSTPGRLAVAARERPLYGFGR